MVTANLQLIVNALAAPTAQSIQTVLEDTKTVFWVDAREPENEIVEACETRLRTGSLSAELAGDHSEMFIIYNQKRLKVPLTGSPQDRHITIFSLNRILNPDYEVRFFTPSGEMDSLAFVALPIETWWQLEHHYGAFVAKVFYKILPEPNLFTDHLAVLNLKQF